MQRCVKRWDPFQGPTPYWRGQLHGAPPGTPEPGDVSPLFCRNGHDCTRRVFRPCKSQKNLQDSKGQFAVEVIFGNPEPSLVILHRGKDIRWGGSTGMDDYHRPVFKSDVTNGRKGQMASDIVRWNIDLEGKLAQHA